MKITSLDQLKDGTRVRGVIAGCDNICEGVVAIEGDRIFICQDTTDGLPAQHMFSTPVCKDLRGYKFSWCVYEGNHSRLGLCNLETIESEGLAGVKYGDILVREGDEYRVLGVCGDIVFISKSYDHQACKGYDHHGELEELGYKLKGAEEQKITVTKEEIAERWGVDVDKLEIIDNE